MPAGIGADGPCCSRRAVLVTVASGVGLAGCLGFGESKSTATRPATATQSPSETPTRTAPSTPTATETPTATDTPTEDRETRSPTPDRNQTQYDVGFPHRTLGHETGDHQLLGDGEDAENGVQPIRSAAEWRQVRTDGDRDTAAFFRDYEFVAETDFDTETLVVVQRFYGSGLRPQIESVSGVGTPRVTIQAERVGFMPVQTVEFRYAFVRLPTAGDEIDRITIEIEENDEEVTLVYDETGTSTPTTTP